MAVVNKNVPVLDRKEWQMMTPAPASSVAGAFVVAGGSSLPDLAMYVVSATAQYLYSHNEDGWVQVPSGALVGTFGAGSCGAYVPWSQTFTATGGSTTTVTVAAATHNITGTAVGSTIEFLSAGTATGQRRVVTGIDNQAGAGTITLTLDYPVATAILNTHTFRLSTGRFFVMCATTSTASGAFKAFDVATMSWLASLSVTGLPASWGTDGRMVSTARNPAVYANGTATSGTTTTLTDTTTSWTVNGWVGYYAVIISGTGAGQAFKITANTATSLTFASAGTAPGSDSVYQIRANPATAIGVATGGSATTLVNSAKNWTVNQWTNYQVRILSGAGAGDKRRITSNTATTLTIASGTALDSTSVYQIEPNEDSLYLLGNAGAVMYLYSVSGNSWSTVAPTTARASFPNTGMTADFVDITGDPIWANENVIQDGRYIYSHRGGASGTLDRFDIAGGTSGAGAWSAVTVVSQETFSTGSAGFQQGRYFYLRQNATNRFFKYDIPGNVLLPFNTDTYPDGTALLGQKIWIKYLDAPGTVQWLYSLANTGVVLRRIGIV